MSSTRGMSLTVQRLLYPLHLAVLVSLHAVLATSRATRLAFRLGHLVFRPWFPRRRAELASLSDDLANQRWSKLPRHLAVSLVSGGGEQRQCHVGILTSLLQWSRQLGVTTLSVYDETGASLMSSSNRLVSHELKQTVSSRLVQALSCETLQAMPKH